MIVASSRCYGVRWGPPRPRDAEPSARRLSTAALSFRRRSANAPHGRAAVLAAVGSLYLARCTPRDRWRRYAGSARPLTGRGRPVGLNPRSASGSRRKRTCQTGAATPLTFTRCESGQIEPARTTWPWRRRAQASRPVTREATQRPTGSRPRGRCSRTSRDRQSRSGNTDSPRGDQGSPSCRSFGPTRR